MKRYSILLLFAGLFAMPEVHAQTGTPFSQVNNMLEFVNPSYAALSKTIDAQVMYRNQWTGVEGAPQMVGFNFRMPFEKAVGLGLKGNFEKSGHRKNTFLGVNADIDVRLGNEMWLLFGLHAGIDMLRYQFGDAITEAGTILDGNYNKNYFAGGYGLSYLWKDLIVGASHYMTFREDDNLNCFYLHGEYRIRLADKWKLRPVVLYHYNSDQESWVEAGVSCTYNDLLTVGVADRIDRQVTFLAELQLLKSLKLSYSYDITTGDVKDFAGSSHEVGVRMSF